MQDIEQAINEMTQEGYRIYDVLVFKPLDNWIPLDEFDFYFSDCATVRLFGRRANGGGKVCEVDCYDMRWLREWWKGGWQANV